jgi:3-phenylpropionate/trans-cinnamate dioxygenase ferredoxin reductase subunit
MAEAAGALDGRIVIIGAGHAGGTAAALLHQHGWTGPITLVGAETRAPYQRPPLSKGLMLGKTQPEELALKPEGFYAQKRIDLVTGRRATRIDRDARTVLLDNGGSLPYDHLIIATGARLRVLAVPGADMQGVMSLRTADDALQLRAAIREGLKVAIVGGGYIGLEAAASARTLGAEVRVVEREQRLMARVASEELSRFAKAYAESKGVEIDLGATVAGFGGENGRLRTVQLADGRSFDCDLALVGIGVMAEQALAQEAGLPCDDGIVVDGQALTSDPHISAIGDCTRRPIPLFSRTARLESVHNAMEQSKQVSARLCGKPQPVQEAPWTWSDQFDLRLQVAGLISPDDRIVLRTNAAPNSFAIFHVSPAAVIRAVEAINAPMDFAFARMAIAKRLTTPPERLGDTAIPLKEVAVAAA